MTGVPLSTPTKGRGQTQAGDKDSLEKHGRQGPAVLGLEAETSLGGARISIADLLRLIEDDPMVRELCERALLEIGPLLRRVLAVGRIALATSEDRATHVYEVSRLPSGADGQAENSDAPDPFAPFWPSCEQHRAFYSLGNPVRASRTS